MKDIRLMLHNDNDDLWSFTYNGHTKWLRFDEVVEEIGKIANDIKDQEGDPVWVPPHNVSVVVK